MARTEKQVRRMRAKERSEKLLREIAAQLAAMNELMRAGDDLDRKLRAIAADVRGAECETR